MTSTKIKLHPAAEVVVIQTEQAYRRRKWQQQQQQALQELKILKALIPGSSEEYRAGLEAEAREISARVHYEHQQLCAYINHSTKELEKLLAAGN